MAWRNRAGPDSDSPAVLQFDEDAARHIQRLYSTPDVVRQREEVLTLLAPRPG